MRKIEEIGLRADARTVAVKLHRHLAATDQRLQRFLNGHRLAVLVGDVPDIGCAATATGLVQGQGEFGTADVAALRHQQQVVARGAGGRGRGGHADTAPVIFVRGVCRRSHAQARHQTPVVSIARQRDHEPSGPAATDRHGIGTQQLVEPAAKHTGKGRIFERLTRAIERVDGLAGTAKSKHIKAFAEDGAAVDARTRRAQPELGGRHDTADGQLADATGRLGLTPADGRLNFDAGRGLLGDRELSTEAGKARNVQLKRTGQLEVAGRVKAGGERPLQAQAIDPRHRGHAQDAARLFAVGADQDAAAAVAQSHSGTAGRHGGIGIARIDRPALRAGTAFLQAKREAAPKPGWAEQQLAGERQLEDLLAVGQLHAAARCQGQCHALLVVGTVPVDHHATRGEQAATAGELAVDVQRALGDGGGDACGQFGRGQLGLAGEPAARSLSAAHHFGRNDQRQRGVLHAGTDGVVAQLCRQARTAEDQLVDGDVRGVTQAHALVGARLDEQLSAGLQHPGHIDGHLPACTGLVVLELHAVAAAGCGHVFTEVRAPAVDRNAQTVSLHLKARHTGHGHRTFGHQRVLCADSATTAGVAQHHRASAIAQCQAGRTGAERATGLVHTDADIGHHLSTDGLSGRDQLELT